MILGITGGTGCGKTTLLNLIRERGGLICDCDAIYHELLEQDEDLLNAIRQRFPDAFDGETFQRKKLGAIVFADEKALLDLNAITHSAVKREVMRRLENHNGLAAIDAIALFEGGLAELCDVTVAVTAPTEMRVIRLMNRDHISESYARARIAAQHDEAWFRQRCDLILENNSDREAFSELCIAFLKKMNIID